MAVDRPEPTRRPKQFPLPNEALRIAPAFLEPPQEVVRGAGLQGDIDRTLPDLRIPLTRPHPTRRPGSLRSSVFRTPDINPFGALHGLPRPVWRGTKAWSLVDTVRLFIEPSRPGRTTSRPDRRTRPRHPHGGSP